MEFEALHSAVREGNSSAALELIARGADVNGGDETGDSTLHYAARNKDPTFLSVMEALIANGAVVNARNSSNHTPLLLAAFRGHVPAIELLVAKGANINAIGIFGATPLLHAATRGGAESVAVLLTFGADINAVYDYTGNTPLHEAACMSPLAAIEALLASGADVNALNKNGLTPLDFANRSPLDPAVLCLAAEGNISKPLNTQ